MTGNTRRTADELLEGARAVQLTRIYIIHTYIGRFQALSAMHVYTHFNTKERGGKNVLV